MPHAACRMSRRCSSLLVMTALCLFAAVVTRAAEPTVTVSAGKHDRRGTIVRMPAPKGFTAETRCELRGEDGKAIPVQVIGGDAVFVLDQLDAGMSRTYRLVQPETFESPAPRVTATRDGGAVRIATDGREMLRYQGEKTALPEGFEPQFQRGGYIHPVTTPAGKAVTDDYPKNHKHHHGVWSPWTKTKFEGRTPDFWNMGAKTGTVEFVEMGETWSGPVAAGLSAKHRFVDLSAKPEPKPALNETWTITAYHGGAGAAPVEGDSFHIFDLRSVQTTAGDSPLVLPQYHYGGMGFRGSGAWDGKDKSQMLTSEGKDRANGNESRGRWVAISGMLDGKGAWCAMLCSPANFRFPQPLRLHPGEPFICWAPQQLGEFSIEPGKPYTMSYRFIAGDGKLDAKLIERLWADYAEPPGVEVK